jgi:hypothetical protein
MSIERTLTQLKARNLSPERARELGCMGYLQWLGALPGEACYETETVRALLRARSLAGAHPAVAVFCELLADSLQQPLRPLSLTLPRPQRRGGARQRRLSI